MVIDRVALSASLSRALLLSVVVGLGGAGSTAAQEVGMSDEGIDALGRFAALALECVHKEWEMTMSHRLAS
jgi:hypothetical protein